MSENNDNLFCHVFELQYLCTHNKAVTLTTAYIYKTQTLVSYGSKNYYIKQSRERIDQCLG